MSRAEFDKIATAIADSGYLVSGSGYEAAIFGSWWIAIDSGAARFRVVWDGRDHSLLLQQERAQNCPSEPEWLDIWVESLVEHQTSSGLLAQLAKFAAQT